MILKGEFSSLYQLLQRFPTEKSCHDYMASRRWDGAIECPFDDCEGGMPYIYKNGMKYQCKCCRRNFTVKTGMIFESSKLPMIKWFMAMYLIMHKKGISSIQLAKDIEVQQKTAWFMLHRIRHVLGNDETNDYILTDVVQLDETFVGGKNINRHYDKKVAHNNGRAFIDKTPVMGMMQENIYQEFTRQNKVEPTKTVTERVIVHPSIVQCHVVPDTKASSLQPFIRKAVDKGSIIVSDEWHGYTGLSNVYQHEIVDHRRKQYVNDNGYTSNAMEGFWSGFKKGIKGIYHQVSRKHLNKYVQEFVFKHNYRTFGLQHQLNSILSASECRLKLKDLKFATPYEQPT